MFIPNSPLTLTAIIAYTILIVPVQNIQVEGPTNCNTFSNKGPVPALQVWRSNVR